MTFSDEGSLVDEIFDRLGWWGSYQRVQFLMVMLPVLPCAMHIMAVVFIGREVEHKCAAVDSLVVPVQIDGDWYNYDVIQNQSQINLTVIYGACSIEVKNGSDTVLTTACTSGYQYMEPADRSFVSEWDLVCDRESMSDLSQTALAVGMTFGAFAFTTLADRYGRKPMYMLSHVCLFAISCAVAFVPNFTVFVILRFFLGASHQGVALISTIMLVEMLPKQRRSLPSEVGNFAWVGALLVLCMVAYLTRETSWRYTALAFAGSSVYVLFQWWVTDESVRWLMTNKKYAAMERVLMKAARSNNVDFQIILEILKRHQGSINMTSPQRMSLMSSECDETRSDIKAVTSNSETNCELNNPFVQIESHIAPQQEEMRLLAFVKNKHIIIITAVSCFMWFTDSLSYYGLLLTSSSLADNLYLGVVLSVVAEIPAGIVFIFWIDRLGRKRTLVVSHVLGGLSLLAASILDNLPLADDVPSIKIIVLCISLVGKFGVATAFAVLWLYSAELYPTNLRNTGFGISSLAARFGVMISPFSRTFVRHIPWGPGVVFACLCLIVPIILRFLPETSGQELPQTLEDLEKWFKPKEQRQSTNKDDV